MSNTPNDDNNDNNDVVDKTKLRAKLARHKPKLKVAALTAAGTTLFILGRKSKDVSVDVDYSPDELSDDQD